MAAFLAGASVLMGRDMEEHGLSTAAAVLIGAVLIAGAIYLRPDAGRYVVTDTAGTLLRVDTATGEAVECGVTGANKRTCLTLFYPGKDLANGG